MRPVLVIFLTAAAIVIVPELPLAWKLAMMLILLYVLTVLLIIWAILGIGWLYRELRP